MEGRRTVEQYGVTAHYKLEDIPNNGVLTIDDALGTLDGLNNTALNEATNDKGFIEFGSHELGQTALAHIEFGTYHDDRTCRVVNTLTEEVLTEAALLALKRVTERLERAIGLALDRGALAGVVEETVNSFLKHAFLITQDNLRGLDFYEAAKAVVANEDATIEVVEVGCGETATIQRHKGTEVGRRDRQHLHDHPLGTVDGTTRAESLNYLKALEGLSLALLRAVCVGTVAKLEGNLVKVKACQEVIDGLGAHLGNEAVLIGLVVCLGLALRKTLHKAEVLFLREEIHLAKHAILYAAAVFIVLGGEGAGIDNHIALIVYDGLELLGGDTEQIAHLAWQGAEVPDMSHRNLEVDMAATLAAHLLLGHLYTATVANGTLIADALVFTAITFIVLDGAKDFLTKEAIALRLVSTIVDGLRLGDFAPGVLKDFLW